MSQTAKSGIQAGFRGILGIQIGNVIFFLCIAFGLVTLVAGATNALVVVQIAGAGYLLYLGLGMIISSLRRAPEETTPARRRGQGSGNVVVQALLVQLTNPKALMFVSALVPQFLDPATDDGAVDDPAELHGCRRHPGPGFVCAACRSRNAFASKHQAGKMD
jgi:homoserine/homoserine lactone efflux protein